MITGEIKNIIWSLDDYFRENTQVPPQPMPEIPETHLYYIKVLLPPWTYFISNFLPLFSLRGTSLKKKSQPSLGPQDSAT